MMITKCGTFSPGKNRLVEKFVKWGGKMNGEAFWDLHKELIEKMVIGLKDQYPQATIDDIQGALLSILMKYKFEKGND